MLNFDKSIEIKISNKFKNCLVYIPKAAKIINIDELACQNIEHCKKCTGSKENLLCAACKLDISWKKINALNLIALSGKMKNVIIVVLWQKMNAWLVI